MHPPLVLLCFPRSYSSVVCAMIGQHPEMYGFPELNLFLTGRLNELVELDEQHETAACLPKGMYLGGLLQALAEVSFEGQTEQGLRKARAWINRNQAWPTARVFEFLLRRIQPRMGVEKSCRTAMSRAALARAASHPGVLFLHLTRHPIAAVRSMLECQANLTVAACKPMIGIPDSAAYYSRLWCFVQRLILAFTTTLPHRRAMRLRAEDALSAPEAVLSELARWIGVRSDPEAIDRMRHPEHSPFARIGPLSTLSGSDPKFLKDPRLRPPIRPSGFELPSEWNLSGVLAQSMCDLTRQLGYA